MPEFRYPDPQLSDGLVTLRPWTLADVAFITAACADPEVSRYSPVIPFPYTEADAREFLRGREPARIAGQALDLAVTDAASGEPLGAIGMHNFSARFQSAETGYWLAAQARGQGYMSAALTLLLRWAFDEFALARIQLTNDPENTRSQAVARRVGFTQEGRLRSHLVVGHSGERRDSLVWGLLRGELRGGG